MERGKPIRPRTFDLPSNTATESQILEFRESNTTATVTAMVSYSVEIAWTFAESRTAAIDYFDNARGDGHFEYFIYRTPDNQYEIPCAGKPGNLYIRAAVAANPVSKLVRGLSICFVRGGERQ